MKSKPEVKPLPMRTWVLFGCAQIAFLTLLGSFKSGYHFHRALLIPSLLRETLAIVWIWSGIAFYFSYGKPRGWNLWRCALTGSSLLQMMEEALEAAMDRHHPFVESLFLYHYDGLVIGITLMVVIWLNWLRFGIALLAASVIAGFLKGPAAGIAVFNGIGLILIMLDGWSRKPNHATSEITSP